MRAWSSFLLNVGKYTSLKSEAEAEARKRQKKQNSLTPPLHIRFCSRANMKVIPWLYFTRVFLAIKEP